MPSPFPGMDPYLEDPARWTGVQQSMITYLCDALQPLLGNRYVAEMGERVYVGSFEHVVYPDVAVVETSERGRPGPATAVGADEPMVLTLEDTEAREVYLEILDIQAGNRVVTAIEILSPSNKDRGNPGYELYRRKQDEILRSRSHLVEIDLLRDGEHTAACPRGAVGLRGPYHYLIAISRSDNRRRREVYPIPLRSRLPRIPIPLVPPDPPVVIDVQSILAHAYDNGAYTRRIDYSRAPVPPLPEAERVWARERASSR
ncbi:MAG: DUF4058 family protein [Planctomycetes bacterium]|nr:DUF4058 family protein [Planctomycetota bacterium]